MISHFILCSLLMMPFALSEEQEHYNAWRQAICEKNNPEMLEEMETCLELEHKVVQDAISSCAKEAAPASNGKDSMFMKAGCKDISIFKKFDTCFEKYQANSAFMDKVALTPEIAACYEKIFVKYGLESLKEKLKAEIEG